MISKVSQINFFTQELNAVESQVDSTFHSLAYSLFDKGELIPVVYRGVDVKRGNLFLEIKKNGHSPRLDSYYKLFRINKADAHPDVWKKKSYIELLQSLNITADQCDVKIIAFNKSDDNSKMKALAADADVTFVENIQLNDFLVLGPKEPPLEYLNNLRCFVRDISDNSFFSELLAQNVALEENRQPQLLSSSLDELETLFEIINEKKTCILQGPPGTGKTYLMASLINRLIDDGESILLTGPTNRSVIEVCEKVQLANAINTGKVHKISLKSQEKAKFPGLIQEKEPFPIKGHLMLSTYYSFSRIWRNYSESIFDWIIVEEASQAVLPTIVAALKYGNKVLVVGDPYQLPPIVVLNQPLKIHPDINYIINGISSLANNQDFPFLRKTKSYRLLPRSVEYTNYFYENTLESAVDPTFLKDIWTGKKPYFINEKGGPTLIKGDFINDGKKSNIIPRLLEMLSKLDDQIYNMEIAILAPFIETVKFLQKNLNSDLPRNNFKIETIDRVQGLDVDICFYIIPFGSFFWSLDFKRFNVATSRAKIANIIIMEQSIMQGVIDIDTRVNQYLKKLDADFSFFID